jgi:hypothetical protein
VDVTKMTSGTKDKKGGGVGKGPPAAVAAGSDASNTSLLDAHTERSQDHEVSWTATR